MERAFKIYIFISWIWKAGYGEFITIAAKNDFKDTLMYTILGTIDVQIWTPYLIYSKEKWFIMNLYVYNQYINSGGLSAYTNLVNSYIFWLVFTKIIILGEISDNHFKKLFINKLTFFVTTEHYINWCNYVFLI